MKSPTLNASRKLLNAGFTLLEVLLTSLLASVVLVSLWSLSDIYLKLFVSGERQIEETQLIRGLTQQIAKDVSQVIQLPEDDTLPTSRDRSIRFSAGSSGGQRMAELAQGTIPDRRSPLEETPKNDRMSPAPQGADGVANSSAEGRVRQSDRSRPKFGLFGTKQALRLIVLQTDPRTVREITDLAEVLPQPGQVRPAIASELRTIEYTFSSSRESGSDYNQHPPGLIRREWAWETWMGLKLASLLTADSAGASDMLPNSQPQWTAEDGIAFENDKNLFHVPQVTGLEFQYYDGGAWEEEWNSWERGKLPLLVEVILQIRVKKEPRVEDSDEELFETDENSRSNSDGNASGSSALKSSSQGAVYRKVIHLPFAEENTSTETRHRDNSTNQFPGPSPQLGAKRP